MTWGEFKKQMADWGIGDDDKVVINIGLDADNVSVTESPNNSDKCIEGWKGHSLANGG